MNIKAAIEHAFLRWLKRRMPARSRWQLNRHNIFILPSKLGVAYIGFVAVLFLLGTNYQNNIIILMSYLFLSVFFTAMLQSFFNLSGVNIQSSSQYDVYAEQLGSISIKLTSEGPRYNLQLSFLKGEVSSIELLSDGTLDCGVHYISARRGVALLPRLKVFSQYPLGLFNCWTQLDMNSQVFTYPKQHNFPELIHILPTNTQWQEPQEFESLARYQHGQSLSKVAWKQYAKEQGKFTKHYIAHKNDQNETRLSLAEMPSVHIEIKLQMLGHLLLKSLQNGSKVSLDLGHDVIVASQGEEHIKQCLRALASYSLDTVSSAVKKQGNTNYAVS